MAGAAGIHIAAVISPGIMSDTDCSHAAPETLRAVEQSTSPWTRPGCLRHSSWAIRPPIEYPTATRRGDAELFGDRGEVVGTVLEPEGAARDAVTVSPLVDEDDAVPAGQRLHDPAPVEGGRSG